MDSFVLPPKMSVHVIPLKVMALGVDVEVGVEEALLDGVVDAADC